MNSILLNLLPLLLSPVFILIAIAYYYDYKKDQKYLLSGFKFILWFVIFMVIYFWLTKILSFGLLESVLGFGIVIPLAIAVKNSSTRNQ
ncbi:hypothetical protein LY01_00717 [Nonlabens xylanidelens]|uniref:Uncharacterized protein n=1 Tax=Nonlabens xylanidelens TaxID=191564 RepID=A0A2S6IRJ5_9FLAO|nr:hypothetical protein [Nonlabens xylanidelens]PPK96892.1 hypothetical protein LY01_00717 [Nonlabens xylanidelens]PQJ13590.1 hypothetical protein BST94_14655 [Nonlabens xylanidelens]